MICSYKSITAMTEDFTVGVMMNSVFMLKMEFGFCKKMFDKSSNLCYNTIREGDERHSVAKPLGNALGMGLKSSPE